MRYRRAVHSRKAPCRSNDGIKIQLFVVVYPSALRSPNTDGVPMWYPPEDQPDRQEHHEDQCNYPFHFFLLCISRGSVSFRPILQLSGKIIVRQNHIPVKCPNPLLLPRNLVSANSIEARARARFYKFIREPQVTLPSRIALWALAALGHVSRLTWVFFSPYCSTFRTCPSAIIEPTIAIPAADPDYLCHGSKVDALLSHVIVACLFGRFPANSCSSVVAC